MKGLPLSHPYTLYIHSVFILYIYIFQLFFLTEVNLCVLHQIIHIYKIQNSEPESFMIFDELFC